MCQQVSLAAVPSPGLGPSPLPRWPLQALPRRSRPSATGSISRMLGEIPKTSKPSPESGFTADSITMRMQWMLPDSRAVLTQPQGWLLSPSLLTAVPSTRQCSSGTNVSKISFCAASASTVNQELSSSLVCGLYRTQALGLGSACHRWQELVAGREGWAQETPGNSSVGSS